MGFCAETLIPRAGWDAVMSVTSSTHCSSELSPTAVRESAFNKHVQSMSQPGDHYPGSKATADGRLKARIIVAPCV